MNDSTKDLLLNAAVEVFASKPFHDATIAEICGQAGANGAAVNYHFGSKESLLGEAIMRAFEVAEESYPLDGKLAPSASAADRLKVFMEAIILRSFDPGPAGQFERIMGHEMGARARQDRATAAKFRKIHDKVLDPIVKDLIRPQSKAELVQARVGIISLCVFQNTVPGLHEALFPSGRTKAALRSYVDSRVAFALAGLKTISKKTICKPSTTSVS